MSRSGCTWLSRNRRRLTASRVRRRRSGGSRACHRASSTSNNEHAFYFAHAAGTGPHDLLLDTDNPLNDPADRPITNILYVRGREMRLHQELILGIGGVRALRALDIQPAAWHLNEGHSAFLLAERARELVERGQ